MRTSAVPQQRGTTNRGSGQSGVFDALETEWQELCRALASGEVFETWKAQQPALARLDGLAEVVDAVRAALPVEADKLLATLLALATNNVPGKDLAARTVLQVMLPRTIRLARALTFVPDSEDRAAYAVAGMYEAIVTYPIQRWPTFTLLCLGRYAGTIIRDGTRQLRNPVIEEILVDVGAELGWLETLVVAESPRVDLRRLLASAVKHRKISREEARRTIAYVTFGGTTAAARRLGIPSDSMRKSRLRIEKKLARFASEYDPDLSA